MQNEKPFYKIYINKKPFFALAIFFLFIYIPIISFAFLMIFKDGVSYTFEQEPIEFTVVILANLIIFWLYGSFLKALISEKPLIEFYNDKIFMRSAFSSKKHDIPVDRILDLHFSKPSLFERGYFKIVVAKNDTVSSWRDRKTYNADITAFKNEYYEIKHNAEKYVAKILENRKKYLQS